METASHEVHVYDNANVTSCCLLVMGTIPHKICNGNVSHISQDIKITRTVTNSQTGIHSIISDNQRRYLAYCGSAQEFSRSLILPESGKANIPSFY